MKTMPVPFLDMKCYVMTSVSTILASPGAKGRKNPPRNPTKTNKQQTISSYLLGKDKELFQHSYRMTANKTRKMNCKKEAHH